MARIRTIKPEFWDSPSTTSVSFPARLLFIALWNWADDHGRGTANLKELEGFAFPNDDEFCGCGGNTAHRSGNTATFRDLVAEVSEAFGVVFYKVNNRPYYEIPSWNEHQRNERRSKASKYPGPDQADDKNRRNTRENEHVAETPHVVAEIPCNVSETPRTSGPGIRNMEQKEQIVNTPPSPSLDADAPTETEEVANENQPTPKPKPKPKPRTYPDDFEAFWDTYPRRTAKADAYKAWKAATKRATPETITQAATRYAQDPNLPDPRYIPYPATWLRSDSWDNPPEPPRGGLTPTQRRLQATLTHGLTWAAQDDHDHALEPTQEDPPWQITA